MTLDEMMGADAEFLTPKDVAQVLGCKPYSINLQAKEDPRKLGFPVCVTGTNVRIPRKAFLYWLQYGYAFVKEAGA